MATVELFGEHLPISQHLYDLLEIGELKIVFRARGEFTTQSVRIFEKFYELPKTHVYKKDIINLSVPAEIIARLKTKSH